MGSGWNGLVPCTSQSCESNKRVYTGTPRRNVRSTPDGGSAVQPPGLSYKAHWEALCCALCLLTTPEISSMGPVWGRSFCPGSRRPRTRVPLVVWAWDFLLCGFLAVVSRPLLAHCFSLCDLRLFVNKRMLLRMEAQLYCLRAAATRLTGKYWAAPYASSLLARSRARARCGAGVFAPAPAALVRASC